jgi:hypothetical protein
MNPPQEWVSLVTIIDHLAEEGRLRFAIVVRTHILATYVANYEVLLESLFYVQHLAE